jgi:hypothetical protein
MNKGRYVFRQMCDFLPTDKIEWIIEKYNGDRYTKTFSCWQHLLVMILAQLWQCRSLPRRFGKSLLTSTLKSFFAGESELFEGQIIYGINLKYIHTIFYSIVLPNKL